jgi:hypothetical protein
MTEEIMENSQGYARSRKRRARNVSRRGKGIGNNASMQEGSTLKEIRLTHLQACPTQIF